MTTHTDEVCTTYGEAVLPDEQGKCSLCGAILQEANQEFYIVTRLHRDDLAERVDERDRAKLTDKDMRWIARKMGEGYCESGAFLDDAEYFAKSCLEDKQETV